MTQSPNQCRVTPDDLFNLLNREFNFDLDAAASAENTKCAAYLDEELNALTCDWVGVGLAKSRLGGFVRLYGDAGESPFSIFCNPPWSDPAPWLEKAYNEAQKSANAVVVVILHQTWSAGVAPWLLKATEIRQLIGRPQFVTPGVANSSNPRDCQIIIFRRKLHDVPPVVWFWDWRKDIAQ